MLSVHANAKLVRTLDVLVKMDNGAAKRRLWMVRPANW